MNESDVVAFLDGTSSALKGKAPAIAFDTNTIFGNTRKDEGINLIDTINRANEAGRVIGAPSIGLVVPAVVLHEKIRQMSQRFGAGFDLTQPMSFVNTKNLRVESFDEPHAIEVAQRLHRLYPNQGDWRAFKKRRYIESLGLPHDVAISRDGSECGATVDWLIVGHAEAMGYLLVTNDTGPEFRDVPLRASLATTYNAARVVLTARGG